jgi:hypothetical protein
MITTFILLGVFSVGLFFVLYLSIRATERRITQRVWLKLFIAVPFGLLVTCLGLAIVAPLSESLAVETLLETAKEVPRWSSWYWNLSGEDRRAMYVIKKAIPAIVEIRTYGERNEPEFYGTGFFINEKGDLITNCHEMVTNLKLPMWSGWIARPT